MEANLQVCRYLLQLLLSIWLSLVVVLVVQGGVVQEAAVQADTVAVLLVKHLAAVQQQRRH
jgi:hypothetical protein